MKKRILLVIFLFIISGYLSPPLAVFYSTLDAKVIKSSSPVSRQKIIEKFAKRPIGKFWLNELFTSSTKNENYDTKLFIPAIKYYTPTDFAKSKNSSLARIRAGELLKLSGDQVASKLKKYNIYEQTDIMLILLYSIITDTSLLTFNEIQKLKDNKFTKASEYAANCLQNFSPVARLSILPRIYKEIYYLPGRIHSKEKKKKRIDTAIRIILSLLVIPDSLVALKFYLFVVKYDDDFVHQEYALENIRVLLKKSHESSKNSFLAPTVWAMEDFIKGNFPYREDIYNLGEPKRLAVVILAELGMRSTWYVLSKSFDKLDMYGFAAEIIRNYSALVPNHEDVSKLFTKSVYLKINKAFKELQRLVKKHVKSKTLSYSIHTQIKDLTFFIKVALDFLVKYGDARKSRIAVEPFIEFSNAEVMNLTFKNALVYISQSAMKFFNKK